MDNIVLSPISLDLLIQQIRDVVKQELTAQKLSDVPEKLLSPAETARFFGVSTKTVHSWRAEGLLKFQQVSRRVYFKHSDLVEAGVKLKKYKRS